MFRYGLPLFLVSVRSVIACLLLASIFVRAIIPAGFMPSSSGTLSTFPSLSLCATGLSPATVQLLGLQGSPHSHDEPISLDCTFASVLNKPLLSNNEALSVMWAVSLWWFSFRRFKSEPWQKQDYGPPLGSRAPPLSFCETSVITEILLF